jgi:hypothetical protein
MTIEVRYIPGCPNYQLAVERLQTVLASQSVREKIHSVPVSTEAQAKALLFPGSPTVRINGRDVEPEQTRAPGLACRIYGDRSGAPSGEVLQLAILGTRRKE